MSAYSTPPAGTVAPPEITDFLQSPRIGMHPKTPGGRSFYTVLHDAMDAESSIQFSAQTLNDLKANEIQLKMNDLDELQRSIEKVKERGGHHALILQNDVAYGVNVDSGKIIAAIPKADIQEEMFKRLDRAIVMD